ncbi:MAG: 16S rRNA (guanine(966)-N(2))-methyltransferase RsmD, partial [Cyanobacteria bacterium K_DeepCast_0m_m1_088]|nr:16S rRNA (guanine(966)-N(2))-methyltransferase RsmD [Cyanobacteria bacterium K_DeepCast_0m_m1_088]
MSLRLSGGRLLQSPPGSSARPTPSRVRLAVMNMLAADLPGCRWLDLFSGSGVMGCEALQRGAAAVVAVDQQRAMASTSRINLERT